MQLSASSEFIGLATDTMSLAFLNSLDLGDDFEYDTFMLTVVEPKASVDWHEYTNFDVDIAAISVNASLGPHTTVSVNAGPFFLDTGATTHITPTSDDFFDLHPIPPRSVKGVGGSFIHAVGIGSMKLIISHGAHMLLQDVLFIPNTSVCLISISALC